MSPEQNDEVDVTLVDGNTEDRETLTPEEIEERKADQADETPEEETPEEETPEEETPEEETPEEETPEEELTPGEQHDLEESQEGDIQAEDGVPLDETIKSYRILGMVDYTDEQGNIRGQLPVGSIHKMQAFVGDLAVEEGRAEEVQ